MRVRSEPENLAAWATACASIAARSRLREAGEQVERLGAAGGFVGVAFGFLPLFFPSGGLTHLLGGPLFAPHDISGEVLLDSPEGLHVEVGLRASARA